MNRFSIHEDAETELSAAANYYESQSPGLGGAFIKEFERAVHQILTYPLSCQLVNQSSINIPPLRGFSDRPVTLA